MTNAINVAQYSFEKMGKWVDAWSLQKLTYYSKAWSLAWDGDPIFAEKFEAWPDGPISRELYRVNKYGAPPISMILPGADPEELSVRQKAVIGAVLEFYGPLNKQALIELTHRELPWQEARNGRAPDASGTNLISDDTIRQTYTRQALLMDSVPKAPHAATLKDVSIPDEAIAEQINKWSETLDWLRTR